MKIILISSVFFDLGISVISPLLKRDGHSVKLLFIPQLLQEAMGGLSGKTVRCVSEFVKDADLIGVNSFSENHFKMVSLIEAVKKTTKAQVIWGGIHATLKPEDCIDHADFVCVGEGEKALLELAKRLEKKEPLEGIKNILFRDGLSNSDMPELYPLVEMDSLLPFDYDLNDQYVAEDGCIRNVKESDFKGTFYSYSARGCPFRCTYCCSGVIYGLYKGQKVHRQRGMDNVIEDLKGIKRRFSSCSNIWFNEADFLSGKTQSDIEHFSQRYKAEIGLPFSIWSNPAAITDDHIARLKGAGLKAVNIGTVNGSERVQKLIYKRSAPPQVYQEKSLILQKYGISVEYDLILCNPYENADDVVSTIKLLMSLPKPFTTVICALTYFPKTELYEMALRDGKINDDKRIQGYTKATYKVWKYDNSNAYLNIVASMMRGQTKRIKDLNINKYGILPEPVLKFLISRPVVKMSKYIPRGVYRAIGGLIKVAYIVSQRLPHFKKG